MQESLEAGQGFTDNEVTLVIDGRSHILSVTAQRMPDGMILLEMAPMDNQRRLSQEQLQHAQQVARIEGFRDDNRRRRRSNRRHRSAPGRLLLGRRKRAGGQGLCPDHPVLRRGA